MKKISLMLLLTSLIFMTSFSSVLAQGSSITAGQGGDISSVIVNPNLNTIPNIEKPSESTTSQSNQVTTTVNVKENDDVYEVVIVKPGSKTEMVVNDKAGISESTTKTEYGTVIQTTVDSNTGITKTVETNKNGDVTTTTIDNNAKESVAVLVRNDGTSVTTTTDLNTNVSTSVEETVSEDGEVIVTTIVATPIVTSNLNGTSSKVVVTANVYTTVENITRDVLILEKEEEKYVEITKCELALDLRSKNVETVKTNSIVLVPHKEIVDKILETKRAESITMIPKSAYATDFYELQIYTVDKSNGEQNLTHEGITITVYLPEYITDNVDPEGCGVIHYEQSEDIFEYVAADSVDIENQTMTFTLRSTSPISYVIKHFEDVKQVEVCHNKHIVLLVIALILFIVCALLKKSNVQAFIKIACLLIFTIYNVYLVIIRNCLTCTIICLIAWILLIIVLFLKKKKNKEDEENTEE